MEAVVVGRDPSLGQHLENERPDLVVAGVDTGPVLAQREVPVEPGDDEATLHERIKTQERALLVETVAALATARTRGTR